MTENQIFHHDIARAVLRLRRLYYRWNLFVARQKRGRKRKRKFRTQRTRSTRQLVPRARPIEARHQRLSDSTGRNSVGYRDQVTVNLNLERRETCLARYVVVALSVLACQFDSKSLSKFSGE